MKHEISAKHLYVTSKSDMQRIVIEMWEFFFSDSKWDGLIASMLERIKAVIKAKGGPTQY